MRGLDPFLPGQAAIELHVSHWSGPLPVLEVSPNWTYGGTLQGLFGRLTYRGEAVHGFRTPSPTRRDPYARFVYIDTFNSVYGPGWKRDTGIVTHQRNGAFCYSFVAQVPPPGYPSSEPRGPGNGERHRVTVMGPGVTPVVRWEGRGLRHYDAASDRVFNRRFDRLVGDEGPGLRARALAHRFRNPTALSALRSRHRPSRHARLEGLRGGRRRVVRPRHAHPRKPPRRSRPADSAPSR